MKKVSINITEEIHHTCLLFGLNRAYARYPFLTRNIMATPPPFMRNPELPPLFISSRSNPISVQYYKSKIHILYNENKITDKEITPFAKAIIDEYLTLRHPFMRTSWHNEQLTEATTGHIIAEIL